MRIAAAVVAVALVTAACDWPWRHDMIDQPSPRPGAGPVSQPAGAMPIDGEPRLDRDAAETRLRSPLDPASQPSDRELYLMFCRPCHGPSGKGDGPVAKFLPPTKDLRSDEVQRHADGWLYATIANGTDKMPPYQHELSRRERWQVVRYVRMLVNVHD
jgi:hypothetical protein